MHTLRYIPVLAIAFAFAACGGQHKKDPNAVTTDDLEMPGGSSGVDEEDMPHMAFDSTAMHFGRITQGEQVERIYRFVNSGKRDLIITDVRSSCGCTIGKDWPKEPVHPGDAGSITVHFNSEGKEGHIDKDVSITANTTPAVNHVHLVGEVIAPTAN